MLKSIKSSSILKKAIVLSVEIFVFIATLVAAMAVSLSGQKVNLEELALFVGGASVFCVVIYAFFGLHRQILRHSDWLSLKRVFWSFYIYFIVFGTLVVFVTPTGFGRRIGFVHAVLFFSSIATFRLLARSLLERLYGQRHARNRRNVLIYGAGAAGRELLASLQSSPRYKVVGFLDDDMGLHERIMDGQIVHSPGKVAALARQYQVATVFIAVPSISRARRREIIDAMTGQGLDVMTLPTLLELADGRARVTDLHEVDIADLLGRDPVAPNADLLRQDIAGQVVLVTGAGGSIGSELCRQIVAQNPATLLLVENSEFALYSVQQDLLDQLAKTRGQSQIVPLLGSVTDPVRMDSVIRTWRPATIYHAAAYKHVPMVEHNPLEGIRTNCIGTYTMVTLADRHSVKRFVLVSTDKAVRSTNVMGATKRIAELVLQAAAGRGATCCFTMVRFGNVLGSSGSVVPLFREQIRRGGPVTITHRDVTRYFMTIPEAAQLVIQAGALAGSGEVFLLDMQDSIRIHDLATRMIRLSGLTVRDSSCPEGDIEIHEVGLRPGEKLYEELLIGNQPEPTCHPRIFMSHEHCLPWDEVESVIVQLQSCIESSAVSTALCVLQNAVTEYQAEKKIFDWVYTTESSSDELTLSERVRA